MLLAGYEFLAIVPCLLKSNDVLPVIDTTSTVRFMLWVSESISGGRLGFRSRAESQIHGSYAEITNYRIWTNARPSLGRSCSSWLPDDNRERESQARAALKISSCVSFNRYATYGRAEL